MKLPHRSTLQVIDWARYDALDKRLKELTTLQSNLTSDPRVDRKKVNALIEPQKADVRAKMEAILECINSNHIECVSWLLISQCAVDLLDEVLEHFSRSLKKASHLDTAGAGYEELIREHIDKWQLISKSCSQLLDYITQTNTTVTIIDELSQQSDDPRVVDTFTSLSEMFNDKLMPQIEAIRMQIKNNSQITNLFS